MVNQKRITKSGAVSLPLGLRRELDLKPGDALDMELTPAGELLLRPHVPRCMFCGAEDVTLYRGKWICAECARGAAKEAGKA